MSLEVGKLYTLDGRPVRCVASVTRPSFVLEFQDSEPVYNGIFSRDTMAGQANQFVVCESSPIIQELKE